ncbi:hypothetical protein [Rhizobium sp. NLR22b]|uniref:hypothetical protein n=1 Tax=Rhizobium sp. NLR22b TaxID=2731115 RepID=UPI001C83970F|nr:hypothetical protein [Rhizobium sp. NLR22b]MBX5242034.1 hypothetical protein [Rhizobium sp. NLR22b]
MNDEDTSPNEGSKLLPRAGYSDLPDELVLKIADNLGYQLGKEGSSDALLGLASLLVTNKRNYRISHEVAEKAGISEEDLIASARLITSSRHLHKRVVDKELAADQPDWPRMIQQIGPTLKYQSDQTKKEFVQSLSAIPDRSCKMAALAELAPYQAGLYPHAKKLLNEAVGVFCERQPSGDEFVEITPDEERAAWFIAHADRFLDKAHGETLEAIADAQHQEWDERGLWLEYTRAEARGDDLSGYDDQTRERILADRREGERLSRRSPEKLENEVREGLNAPDPERRTLLIGQAARSMAKQLDRRRELGAASRDRSRGRD